MQECGGASATAHQQTRDTETAGLGQAEDLVLSQQHAEKRLPGVSAETQATGRSDVTAATESAESSCALQKRHCTVQ